MNRPIYLPWVRAGLAGVITEPDPLLGPLPSRTTFTVSALIDSGQSGSVEVRIMGPGDVVGIDPRLVLRTQPEDRSTEVETNYFCTAELRTSDLPWMFTTAAPNADRLRPFVVLVVVPTQTCRLDPGSGNRLPVLHIDDVSLQLPDLGQSYAWAHAEVADQTADLSGPRPRGLARLLCPRLLQPRTAYVAAVVPAFETGRLAGLGLPIPEADTMQPAWDAASADPIDLPVYHHSTFTTGEDGDFEALVSRLKRVQLAGDTAAGRPAAVDAQAGLPALPGWRFPGALGLCPDPDPGPNFTGPLAALIDGSASWPGLPLPPPRYGDRHAAEATIAGSTRPWLRRLNLDPRYRSAAAIGGRLIQEHQEDLMAAAWAQIGDVEAANALLRQAQLARSAATAMHERMTALDAGVLLQLAGPMLSRLRAASAGLTVSAAVAASRVPSSMVSGAFRRMLRPRGGLGRRTGRRAAALLAAVNDGTPVVPLRPLPSGIFTIDKVRPKETPRWCEIKAEQLLARVDRPLGAASPQQWQAMLKALAEAHVDKPPCGPIPSGRLPLPLASTRTAILTQTLPETTISKRIGSRVTRPPGLPRPSDPLAPIMATPRLDTPLSRDLIALAPDLLLPGISGLPPEAVSAVPQNRRFVEALMVGANHEMMRELIWRGYPTDQRGTCLHRFWERGGSVDGASDDIPAIDETWAGELGSHLLGEQNLVVVVVRGEVLRRYPRTVIYAARAQWVDGRRRPEPASPGVSATDPAFPERHPAFVGVIPPDVAYVGFDLPSDARGDPDPAANNPGWFFVFQQPSAEVRFGLDATRSENVPGVGASGPVLASGRHEQLGTCRPVASADRRRPPWLGTAGDIRRPGDVVRAETVPRPDTRLGPSAGGRSMTSYSDLERLLARSQKASDARRAAETAYQDALAEIPTNPRRVTTARKALDRAELAAAARAKEFRTALDATIGNLDRRVPLLLLPVRLETRYDLAGSRTRLRIRVYPDDIHLDSHEPELTDAEIAAGEAYWQQIWLAQPPGRGTERQRAWTGLVTTLGAERASWVARVLAPTNPRDEPAPTFPAPARRAARWTRATQARLLPDFWQAEAWRAGTKIAAATGGLIRRPLAAGMDPGTRVGDSVDPGMLWMTDFDAAVEAGMAFTMDLPDRNPIDLLTVFGVCGTKSAAMTAAELAGLLQAHRFGIGDSLALVAGGTPTNNTEDAPAGYGAPDSTGIGRFVDPLAPPSGPASGDDGDADRLRLALGVPFDTLGELAGASNRGVSLEADMATLLWPATWGYYLTQMLRPEEFDQEGANWRRWTLDTVRAGGPLPVLRAGRQPYGVLPMTSMRRWRTPSAAGLVSVELIRPAGGAPGAPLTQVRILGGLDRNGGWTFLAPQTLALPTPPGANAVAVAVAKESEDAQCKLVVAHAVTPDPATGGIRCTVAELQEGGLQVQGEITVAPPSGGFPALPLRGVALAAGTIAGTTNAPDLALILQYAPRRRRTRSTTLLLVATGITASGATAWSGPADVSDQFGTDEQVTSAALLPREDEGIDLIVVTENERATGGVPRANWRVARKLDVNAQVEGWSPPVAVGTFQGGSASAGSAVALADVDHDGVTEAMLAQYTPMPDGSVAAGYSVGRGPVDGLFTWTGRFNHGGQVVAPGYELVGAGFTHLPWTPFRDPAAGLATAAQQVNLLQVAGERWRLAAGQVRGVRPADPDPDRTLLDLLATDAVSETFERRPFVGNQVLELHLVGARQSSADRQRSRHGGGRLASGTRNPHVTSTQAWQGRLHRSGLCSDADGQWQ